MDQMAEHLPNKYEALSLNPTTIKREKKNQCPILKSENNWTELVLPGGGGWVAWRGGEGEGGANNVYTCK
jgi:hypothetical protein